MWNLAIRCLLKVSHNSKKWSKTKNADVKFTDNDLFLKPHGNPTPGIAAIDLFLIEKSLKSSIKALCNCTILDHVILTSTNRSLWPTKANPERMSSCSIMVADLNSASLAMAKLMSLWMSLLPVALPTTNFLPFVQWWHIIYHLNYRCWRLLLPVELVSIVQLPGHFKNLILSGFASSKEPAVLPDL